MKPKSVGILAAAVIALGLAFYQSDRSTKGTSNNSSTKLFGDVDGESIGKLTLTQGANHTELSRVDGVWRVVDRGGFQASPTKVRSLLFKILDLSVSQKVTDQPANFDSLGVGGDVAKSGRTSIAGFDEKGTPLLGLILGIDRNIRKEGPSSGQYVRRDGDNSVYLIPESIAVMPRSAEWIDKELFSIPAKQVRSVQQFGLNPEAKEFTLVSSGFGDKGTFRLEGQTKELDPTVVAQVTSGLESAEIADVVSASDESVKALAFDGRTVFTLQNGLVYSLDTIKKVDKHYLKISVRFDENVAAQVQSEVDAVNKANAEKAAAALNQTTAASAAPSEVKPAQPELLKVNLSSKEEAEKFQAGYKDWVFLLDSYLFDRYRQSAQNLTQRVGAPPATSEPKKILSNEALSQ